MSDKPVVTMISIAERLFAESAWRPSHYLRGFVEDVARAIHVGKLEGIAQERARVVAVIEAEQLEWRADTSQDQVCERLLRAVRQ